MPDALIGSTIVLRSTRAPSAWLPFQLFGSWATARRRVPPSSTSSYSARVDAVDGSSDASSAFFLFSSAASSACSSEAFGPQGARARAPPRRAVPCRTRRRWVLSVMCISFEDDVAPRRGDRACRRWWTGEAMWWCSGGRPWGRTVRRSDLRGAAGRVEGIAQRIPDERDGGEQHDEERCREEEQPRP